MWITTRAVPVLCLAFMITGLATGLEADNAHEVKFPDQRARFVRLVINSLSRVEPCIDELEVYGPDGKVNLALAQHGAKAIASTRSQGHLSLSSEYWWPLGSSDYGVMMHIVVSGMATC